METACSEKEITAECPCVGHCTTALGDDVCRSCLRTFEEVTFWPEMTDEQRIAVNRRIALENRKFQQVERPSPRERGEGAL